MELHQAKTVSAQKRNDQQNEKAIYRMVKVFANHISGKQLVFKKYNKFIERNMTLEQHGFELQRVHLYADFFYCKHYTIHGWLNPQMQSRGSIRTVEVEG